ncbi:MULTISPECIES: oxidoreductase [Pseudonocardia]|uniref:3-oxoacyl-[acyl-carrier-protein] reductase FabG n=2 Tax=Pseudonocardia TaxID=1847 RepID=A0A1Y2N3T2_PSEAH|nr:MULTISPECIES: oxidoreductase [Pseudonocardia]OSY42134.1 3-oxoacyl-[acyl-carrier-protein] reductase FabG [Pseudonocardia autotrophica]TDN75098.1 NAD(P)-dependent dehydrogenase (short-subunit alcohol dehydrogenase family) [Pseudonocardia autotrophica]BBF99042.1 short-chain dehydrogenase [Pseudonocardia autotrophica]GEC23962.1 short-chain dehydrogenase [Pseudonocardia saturnea]
MTVRDEGLSGLRVLVTGGSRGLGEATVRRFAGAGAEVVTASRSAPPADLPATFIRADLATEQDVEDLGRRVLDSIGGVDILVNNAGAASGPAPTLARSDESWVSDLDMNLLAAVRLDRALVPGMVERGSGVVVHVSSIASRLPQRGEASYAAAKAALNAYSRELATEVGGHGVRVVCVLPGFVITDGALAHLQTMAEQQGIGVEEVKQQIVNHLDLPMGRPGDPEDVAEMIAFLASDRARWLSGAEFRVDGGILPMV